jgi:hypothetical protein
MAYLTSAKKAEIARAWRSTMPRKAMEALLDEIAAALASDIGGEESYEDAGLVALGVVRIEAAVEDGETVVIGDDTYEFDTDDAITEGNIQVDVSGGSEVASQGTLTVDTQPLSGDTMTIGTKEYTFVPDGTANADGEIDVGEDLAGAKVNIVAAINGEDGFSTAHTLVTAADFVTNDCVITAITPGTAGDDIATTETFDEATNVFDAVKLGTTTAGVDATADEATAALETVINASATEAVVADKIDANEVLILADAVGDVTLAMSETMGGANNTVWDTAMGEGAAVADKKMVTLVRVPTATEVATGNLHVALDFEPVMVLAQVRVTTTGAAKAWDGDVIITGGSNPYVTLNNDGSTDWATTDTIHIMAAE